MEDTQENNALQMSMIRAPMSSQRPQQCSQHLHGSAPVPLFIYYGFQFTVFMGFLSVEIVPSLGLFSSVGFVQFSVFLFYITFYYILLSLRSLFSNERQKGSTSGWEGKWEGTGKSTGRGNCMDTLCVGKSILKKKKKYIPVKLKHFFFYY